MVELLLLPDDRQSRLRQPPPEAPDLVGHIGIGIAHGPTTVGPIGFRGRLDYAAIGGVPNLAARLSAAAADGQILLDATTAERVAATAALAPLGPLPIKGFAAPQPVFEVLGQR